MMKKFMVMAAMMAVVAMTGCGKAIPATTAVDTQKLEVGPTIVENIEVENREVETIIEEKIEEEETKKRELGGVLRFVNDKGAVMFYMATYDDDFFTIDKSLDKLVETLNEECEATYIRVEENDKYVIKSIDEKKNVTSIWMVTVHGNENDF